MKRFFWGPCRKGLLFVHCNGKTFAVIAYSHREAKREARKLMREVQA